MADEKYDEVNRPAHYFQSSIQAADVIEDWKLGYCLGNVLKYISRADHKGRRLQDLQKAAWYLNREIEESIRRGEKA